MQKTFNDDVNCASKFWIESKRKPAWGCMTEKKGKAISSWICIDVIGTLGNDIIRQAIHYQMKSWLEEDDYMLHYRCDVFFIIRLSLTSTSMFEENYKLWKSDLVFCRIHWHSEDTSSSLYYPCLELVFDECIWLSQTEKPRKHEKRVKNVYMRHPRGVLIHLVLRRYGVMLPVEATVYIYI